ncbi:MAG TPA: hypothetical protein VFQ67_05910 [Allosphingosinicella sp.]|jgi:CspA family cold shock protein|nr:hypothetical protein [Allosphingosinicella sp.]
MGVMGVVRYFDRERGLGAITLADGREAVVRARRLPELGGGTLGEGLPVEVEVEEGPKGLEVARLIG